MNLNPSQKLLKLKLHEVILDQEEARNMTKANEILSAIILA